MCMGRQAQLGLALQNIASNSDGRLPYLSDQLVLTRPEEPESTDQLPVGWPIQLLPFLDHLRMFNSIQSTAIPKSEINGATVFEVAPGERIVRDVFVCPSDFAASAQPGQLSHVINAGFLTRQIYYGDSTDTHRLGLLSWNGNPISDELIDVEIGDATCVFFPKSSVLKRKLDDIANHDGLTQTLMLTENINAGFWYDTAVTSIGFGLPVENQNNQVLFGKGMFFESDLTPLNTDFEGSSLLSASPRDWRINKGLELKSGSRPRPSSSHPGCVNVRMCDGSGRKLSANIDPRVYVKMLTSNGTSYGELPIKESEFAR